MGEQVVLILIKIVKQLRLFSGFLLYSLWQFIKYKITVKFFETFFTICIFNE